MLNEDTYGNIKKYFDKFLNEKSKSGTLRVFLITKGIARLSTLMEIILKLKVKKTYMDVV